MEVARNSIFSSEVLDRSIGVGKSRDRKKIFATKSRIVKEEKEDGLEGNDTCGWAYATKVVSFA